MSKMMWLQDQNTSFLAWSVVMRTSTLSGGPQLQPAYIRWSPLSHNIWKMWAICAERRISIERTNKYCSIVLQIIEQIFLHQQNVILYWRPTLPQLHCRYTVFKEMRKQGNSLMNFSSSVTSLALNPWYQNFFITVCVLCIFC